MSSFEAIALGTFLAGFAGMGLVTASSAHGVPFHIGLSGRPGTLANRWLAFAVYQALAAFFVYVAFTTSLPGGTTPYEARGRSTEEFVVVSCIVFVDALHYGMWAVAGGRWQGKALTLMALAFVALLAGVAFFAAR